MNLLISALISFSLIVGALNVPAHWFNLRSYVQRTPTLGSAFTTVAGTNQLSAFPALYNTNLGQTANTTTPNSWSGLQQFNGQASSTLFSCTTCYFGGTATSSFSPAGALTLITPLTVANGGTGSTTLSSNQVLLGNGTGNIGTVSGWGTSGQFLTSNGGVSAPTWSTSAVDQTINYAWTGFNSFNASTTGKVGIGTTSPTISNALGVQGNAYISGALYVGKTLTSTSTLSFTGSTASTLTYASSTATSATNLTLSGTASTSGLIVSNTAALPFYATTSATVTVGNGAGTTVTATAYCLSGDYAIAAGYNPSDTGSQFNVILFLQATTDTTGDSWTVSLLKGTDNFSLSNSVTAYCLNQ